MSVAQQGTEVCQECQDSQGHQDTQGHRASRDQTDPLVKRVPQESLALRDLLARRVKPGPLECEGTLGRRAVLAHLGGRGRAAPWAP